MRRHLAIVLALAGAGLLAALLPAPVWLRAVLLVPLVLVLPGYALAANFFAPGTTGASERAVYALTLSIATTAVAGLLTQLLFGLSRDAWAIVLFAVTAAAAGRALRLTPTTAPPPRRRLPWGMAPAALAFALAAVVTTLAIVSAHDGLREAQAKIRFTDFWLLPGEGSTDGATTVSVGLSSHEGKATAYRLRLSRGNASIATRALELRTGEEWERSFPLAKATGNAPVTATLFREGEPYRHLYVTPQR